ncbi:MAG: methylamine methyltransferase corrinoid protein reductive activase [Methanomassiliicoccales archaeon]|nr:methylamine methyltransferase corrinoid protein reductive activase [Methanomassiliicoccales archaeon]
MAERYGVAIDIGTSGLRAQSIDLADKKVIATAITLRHPLPGANVMDHLHFAIDVGEDFSNRLIVQSLNFLLKEIHIDLQKVERAAVCGNPIQLSLFQNIEIRDLAYAGERARAKLGVENVRRDARVIKAGDLGLELNPEADVLIPPAVKHEIGADALAMMYETDFLNCKGIAMVTDFGTNAEMALRVGDEIFTGSAAAGPAIEGQHIKQGMLAAPGAISDVEPTLDGKWRTYALNESMYTVPSDVVDPLTGEVLEQGGVKIRGITGTGVIGLVATGLEMGLMKPGKMLTPQKLVRLQGGVVFDEEDYVEVGKTIAAFTAGHITLATECGISLTDIKSMYMSGASGTYMSSPKAARIGLIPGTVERTVQAGNTSLAMSRDLVRDPHLLDLLQEKADGIRARHIMFANSKVFENAFAVELGVWTQGMSAEGEDKMLRHFGLEPRPALNRNIEVIKLVQRDIQDIGPQGLKVVEDIGIDLVGEPVGCLGDARCVKACQENAIRVDKQAGVWRVVIASDLCMGTACRRCERACKLKVLRLENLRIAGEGSP